MTRTGPGAAITGAGGVWVPTWRIELLKRATEDELRAFLRQSLAAYKIPKKISLVGPGTIPVNATGKFVKSAVKEGMGW